VPQLRRLVAGFPPRRPEFQPRSGHVGFVVDKVALGQGFSEYFGFPCQFSFHRLLHTHHHLSSLAGTVGQLVDSVSPHPKKLERKKVRVPWCHLELCQCMFEHALRSSHMRTAHSHISVPLALDSRFGSYDKYHYLLNKLLYCFPPAFVSVLHVTG
jgi:hypothetical protein